MEEYLGRERQSPWPLRALPKYLMAANEEAHEEIHF